MNEACSLAWFPDAFHPLGWIASVHLTVSSSGIRACEFAEFWSKTGMLKFNIKANNAMISCIFHTTWPGFKPLVCPLA